MNLSKQEAIELVNTKGVDHYKTLEDVHVIGEDGKEIKFTVAEKKIEASTVIEKTVSPITINSKDNKMDKMTVKQAKNELYNEICKSIKEGRNLNIKSTTSTTLSGAIPIVTQAFQEEILDEPILSMVQVIPLQQMTTKLPTIWMSGSTTTTPETSGKTALSGKTDYVEFNCDTYAGYVIYTNQVEASLPAFQDFAGRAIVGKIREDLGAAVVEDILSNGGTYHQSGISNSGVFSQTDALNMYARLEQNGLRNAAWLINPVNWVTANLFDSGIRITMNGPIPTLLGLPVIICPKLVANASGAYGTVVLAGLGNVGLGQFGTFQEDYNPYYGWTTNESSVRCEIYADVECLTAHTFVRTNGSESGWTSAYYVALSGK